MSATDTEEDLTARLQADLDGFIRESVTALRAEAG